jgi:TPR repeat protein
VWLPASNDDTDCKGTTIEDQAGNLPKECGQSNQETATGHLSKDDFNLTQVSQAEGLTETLHPTPTPANHPPAPEFKSHENPATKPSITADPPTDRTETTSNDEKSASSVPPTNPISHPTPDAQLAEPGDAFAQYRLGKYYAKQNGQEAPESISWYRKASKGLRRLAEAGNGQAMYVLGVMYAYGRGVVRNTEEARRWLTQAVEQNVRAAQPVLANLEAKQTADPKPKDKRPAQSAKP